MEHTKSLFLILFGLHFSADSHMMKYYVTVITPDVNFPEFTVVGELDNMEVESYDSNTKRLITKIEWSNKSVAEAYFTEETKYWQKQEKEFIEELQSHIKSSLQNDNGVHTYQVTWCCQQGGHGNQECDIQRAYKERSICLEYNAQVNIKEQERNTCNRGEMHPLKRKCWESLKKYTFYGRAFIENKVPPEVSLFQKDAYSPVVCHATGFFPREVDVFWRKNEQDLGEEKNSTETLPNHNGTFQRRNILNISFDELDKNNYTCVVDHGSLENEIILTFKHSSGGFLLHIKRNAWIVGSVVLVLLLLVCVGLIWKKRATCKSKSDASLEVSEHRMELSHTSYNVTNCPTTEV